MAKRCCTLTARNCFHNHPLDSFGHHPCARETVPKRKETNKQERGAAHLPRIWRTVHSECHRPLLKPLKSPRLEIVADGLPFFGRDQLAIDTTLVNALRSDGKHAADFNGIALDAFPKKNTDVPFCCLFLWNEMMTIRTALHSIERTSPDLSREKGTCPVVYVGGRRKRNSKMSLLKTTNIHSVDRSRNAPKIGQKRKNRALDAVECHLGLRRFSGVHGFIAKPLSCIRQKRCSNRGRSVENVLRDCLRLFRLETFSLFACHKKFLIQHLM